MKKLQTSIPRESNISPFTPKVTLKRRDKKSFGPKSKKIALWKALLKLQNEMLFNVNIFCSLLYIHTYLFNIVI